MSGCIGVRASTGGEPTGSNATAAGVRQNRRVWITVPGKWRARSIGVKKGAGQPAPSIIDASSGNLEARHNVLELLGKFSQLVGCNYRFVGATCGALHYIVD
ncbi:hypothetical protein SAMN06269301_1479 [Geobacter sp. DSM 9736]|nr:hypothetical protein SAMN06269301_1479 [Geobacter sp. DSM 9736]